MLHFVHNQKLLERASGGSEKHDLIVKKDNTIMVIDHAGSLPQTNYCLENVSKNGQIYLAGFCCQKRWQLQRRNMEQNCISKRCFIKTVCHKETSCYNRHGMEIELIFPVLYTVSRNCMLMFPVFFYGAETWIMKAEDHRRIVGFQMLACRRMLRTLQTEKRTNESILK